MLLERNAPLIGVEPLEHYVVRSNAPLIGVEPDMSLILVPKAGVEPARTLRPTGF